MSLREYARKRRAGETPEPFDDTRPGKRGRRPIFVVQLHHARARHYDFRLEMDGTLKSWAVPKGPSLRAGEKRLAVEVEDHPLGYAGFSGDIPKGHYGAGHVDIFDRGVWNAEGDPLAGLAAGKIDFELHGDKLHGAWKLVRTQQRRSGKPQWLLLKRDDAWARDAEADDLVAGVGAPGAAGAKGGNGTAATPRPPRAKPGKHAGAAPARRSRASRPDWAGRAAALPGARARNRNWKAPAPQLATLRQAPPQGDDWLHELKWDGYRLLAEVVAGKARLLSRNGLDWTADYPEIVVALERLGVAEGSFDGELIALDPKGGDDFALLQRTIQGSARGVLRYMLFDLPSLAGSDLMAVPLDERKALLESLLEGADPVLAYSRHIVGHGPKVFAASATQGMEGIISKALGAHYTPGRSATWLKTKHAQSDEFVIVGFTAPKRSRTGFGSLLMATREHGALKYVGRVGTGFDDAQLRSLLARLQPLARTPPTVTLPAHVPFRPRDVTWVEPRLVAELAFRGWGKEGLLRQASFQRLREDKTMDDIGDQSAPAQRLTSPGKVVYPELGLSKQQVADYYRAVTPWLLPELVRRPLSLLRCPDGLKGQCFFQKHHAGTLGAAVHAVPIREKNGGSDDYLYVDDIEGVLDLVQMNTLELHPWGARIGDVEHPDRLVFDLDPGEGVDWKAIVAAARDVRARLQEIGMQSFVRLSGGKGLHVVVPIAPGPDWGTAKAFCEAFADAMATQAPDKYVATASKAKRRGVIFIDWLRNGRGATSVASWSLRARKEAGVAMPLAWSELGRTKSGADYPLPRAQRRAASLRKDPWDGWAQATQQELVALD
ncbi:DNA ligase D [Luteimonas sp. 50]|uniref:DNA ligase (ATP) n=1 Tax=Cognatiluteimonas sedimenti TaxID=2927791 RepID=A0ABT0A0V2_9GAMM|nr:DNA ligase D [Lysobacter sedimenti]MCJ0824609.1 DNA ligase D [Lysobacter sedimenti]